MNKIYNLVWNTSIRQLVAVSELAKGSGGGGCASPGRPARLRRTALTLAFVLSALGMQFVPATAQAQVSVNNSTDGTCYNIADGRTPPAETVVDATRCSTVGTGNVLVNSGELTVGGTVNTVGGTFPAAPSGGFIVGLEVMSSGAYINGKTYNQGTLLAGTSAPTVGSAIADFSTAADLFNSDYFRADSTAAAAAATGTDSVAVGPAANASGTSSVTLGSAASATGDSALAAGVGASASGDSAVAVGAHNLADGANSLAAGSTNKIYVGSATATASAVGYDNAVAGNGSVGVGEGNRVGNFAVDADGNFTRDANNYLQLGGGTNVLRSHAFGGDNLIGAVNIDTTGASAIGEHNWAAGVNATAMGSGNVVGTWTAGADGVSAIATASASHSTAVGDSNATKSGFASVFGYANNVEAGSRFSATLGADNNLDGGSTNATAVGSNNEVSAARAVALGFQNTASAADTFAAGSNNTASGVGSMAVGTGNVVSGVDSGAFGDPNNVSGTDSYAFGNDNTIDADNAFVLGNDVTIGTGLDGAVALGDHSTVVAATATPTGTIAGVTYNYAGGNPAAGSVASVGAAGSERQVQNVAAGQVTAASTDAVNGSQLFATQQAIDVVAGQLTHDYSVNSTASGTDTNFGNAGATGANALAAGVSASATATDAAAIGGGAQATVDGAMALGAGSISDRALAPASGVIGGTFIPFNTTDLTLLGALSVGNSASYRQITNVADGIQPSDAVTVRQLTGALTSFSTTTTKYFHANSTLADSLAVGDDSIAVGPTTIVNGDNGVGMGFGALVQQTAPGGVAIGQNAASNQADAIALGTQATASGIQSVSLGAGSSTSTPTSVAIGPGASAGAQAGDVALGANSTTSTVVGTSSATIGGTTYNFAGASPTSTVSVGAAGSERTVTNVAAGRLSATSTDAVNGSQLYATNRQVTANTAAITTLSSSVSNDVKYYKVNSTAPESSATGTDAVAAGPSALASGSDAVAAGSGSTASGPGSTAVGAGSTSTGDSSVAIGAGSTDDGQANVVSVGSAGNERKITHVAAGSAPTDAVNVSQLQASQKSGVHYDTNRDGSTDYTSVTLDAGGDAAEVHNVATGVAETDAVNVGQLSRSIAGAVKTANLYTDQRFNELKGSLGELGNRANAGIASAIAAASLPQPYAPNQSSLGVALGSFHGEAGIAVGLSRISESGHYIIKANVSSDSRGDFGAGVGAGIVW